MIIIKIIQTHRYFFRVMWRWQVYDDGELIFESERKFYSPAEALADAEEYLKEINAL